MPIHYYTWTALLDGESISFRILESSEKDARKQLIDNLEKMESFREKYDKFERRIDVNKQNKLLIEKKTMEAYAIGDELAVETLERVLQTIHGSFRRVQYDKKCFLESMEIDTSGMIEEVSPFSVYLDAVVRTYSGEEMFLREFILTPPSVTPFHHIEIFHCTDTPRGTDYC
jgi:hypothetical protein